MKIFVGPYKHSRNSAAIQYAADKKVAIMSAENIKNGTMPKSMLEGLGDGYQHVLLMDMPLSQLHKFITNYGNKRFMAYRYGIGHEIDAPEIIITVNATRADIPDHHHFNQRVDVIVCPDVDVDPQLVAMLRDFTSPVWPHKVNYTAMAESHLMMEL